MNEEYPPKCPKCGSRKVEIETKREDTGGGFADSWDEFYCQDCEYEWRSDTSSGYAQVGIHLDQDSWIWR